MSSYPYSVPASPTYGFFPSGTTSPNAFALLAELLAISREFADPELERAQKVHDTEVKTHAPSIFTAQHSPTAALPYEYHLTIHTNPKTTSHDARSTVTIGTYLPRDDKGKE
ncbi:hypothetical protein DXG03_000678 [Asterophora parasitica]|uniref:Uncharacterized protein n=1 Tax=Asterophora parasitica TaxID=117018 RepID=A0A9P7GAA3_9AGAR|nr:hypothetical protein DXG03_000678 [Asterophora parasitica]